MGGKSLLIGNEIFRRNIRFVRKTEEQGEEREHERG